MARRGRTERQIDDLFRLPLERFTGARNDLASKVDDGGRIRALRKPGVPAWAVNQLHWKHRRAFERLLRAGDRLRRAQQAGGGAAALQAAGRERREALSSLMTLAETILSEAGHATSPATLRRIAATLEALAAGVDPSPAGGPGRLQEDLEPPGFEALLGTVAPRPRSRSGTEDAAERRRELARTAVRKAEEKLAGRRKAAEGAEESLQAAEEAARSAADAIRESRERLAAAERAGRRAGADLDRARRRAQAAEAEVIRAERALQEARRTGSGRKK